MGELLRQMVELKKAGLAAERIAFSFMKHRVQPLMKRDHYGYEYTGSDDNSRFTSEDIPGELVMERLKRIFKNLEGIPVVVLEFFAGKPSKPVSSHSL